MNKKAKIEAVNNILNEVLSVVADGIKDGQDEGLTVYDLISITFLSIAKRDEFLVGRIKEEMDKGLTKDKATAKVVTEVQSWTKEQFMQEMLGANKNQSLESFSDFPKDNVRSILDAKDKKGSKKETYH